MFQFFIELSRIKKCFTQKDGIFVLEEFGKITVALFCFFPLLLVPAFDLVTYTHQYLYFWPIGMTNLLLTQVGMKASMLLLCPGIHVYTYIIVSFQG